MRNVNIDFTAENMLPDGACLGKKGEHNATELIITPPAELAGNDDVACYIIAFQIGAHKMFRTELIEKAEQIRYKLPISATKVNTTSLQLEGYDTDENLIIKSVRIDGLYFEDSVCGEDIDAEADKSIISEISANTLARHSHTNKSTLDKFGETDGSLTYDGKSIGGSGERPTAQETFLYDDYELVPDTSIIQNSLTVVSFGEIEKIPVGTEIKTIEFLYNETWVDIHEMFEIDTVPYSVNIGKAFYSEQNGCYIYGNAFFPLGSVNVIAENIINGAVTETRITYYTD